MSSWLFMVCTPWTTKEDERHKWWRRWELYFRHILKGNRQEKSGMLMKRASKVNTRPRNTRWRYPHSQQVERISEEKMELRNIFQTSVREKLKQTRCIDRLREAISNDLAPPKDRLFCMTIMWQRPTLK